MFLSNLSMVATSCKSGTLFKVTGSALKSAAHSSGSAAFLAPEMLTSPFNALPPWMINWSMGFKLQCSEGLAIPTLAA